MQGGNIRASINVDLNLGDALGGINKLKAGLKQLKIPANATKGFINDLDQLTNELEKFDNLRAQPIKAGDKTGMKNLEKSYQKIFNLAGKINSEFSKLGGKGKSLISEQELQRMSQLQKEWGKQKQIQDQIANKKKQISEQENKRNRKEQEYLNKINKNKGLADQREKEAKGILKSSKTLSNYVKAIEAEEKALKKTNDIKRTGTKKEKEQANNELKKAQAERQAAERRMQQYGQGEKYNRYQQIKEEEARALKESRKAQTDLDREKMTGGSIDNMVQDISKLKAELKSLESGASLNKIRAEFAALAGISIDKVPNDIEELNNEIKSLQSNKIEQLKNALDQLGNSSGIDRMTQDLHRGQQQMQQYRGEFDKLTMKQRDIDDMKYRLTNFFSWSEGLNLVKMGAREAFRAVKELDDAMTGTAVVTDFTVSDLWDMMPKYTETANKLGATVQGAYETMTLYYQQGLDTEAAFGMGTETMKMSRIADMDYVEGTDLMTAAIRGFHMDLTETSAKWVNDVYSELAAISASDTHEIATAMTKTASIADSANADFDTTAAFLTQMINFAIYTRVA